MLCAICKEREAGKSDVRCSPCNRIHMKERKLKMRAELEYLRERNTVLQAKWEDAQIELKSLRNFRSHYMAAWLEKRG